MTNWAQIFKGLWFYCYDTPSENTGLWQLPVVYLPFNTGCPSCLGDQQSTGQALWARWRSTPTQTTNSWAENTAWEVTDHMMRSLRKKSKVAKPPQINFLGLYLKDTNIFKRLLLVVHPQTTNCHCYHQNQNLQLELGAIWKAVQFAQDHATRENNQFHFVRSVHERKR